CAVRETSIRPFGNGPAHELRNRYFPSLGWTSASCAHTPSARPLAAKERQKMQWQDKYTHWLQGAAAGVFVVIAGGLYQGSIMTWGSAKEQAEAAAAVALLPFCVKDVMADSTAAAELKVKRTHDYDD